MHKDIMTKTKITDCHIHVGMNVHILYCLMYLIKRTFIVDLDFESQFFRGPS